jgi:WD40 repeat protein
MNDPKPRIAMVKKPHRYDAFISYSHQADGRLARALEAHLERFAKPWFRLRSANVFRDETSLSASPELWPTIVSHLDDASYLILLASPLAVQSKWVRREICHWITAGGCDDPSKLDIAQIEPDRFKRLLIVLTEGDIAWDELAGDFDWSTTTALPSDILRGKVAAEPLWLDMKWVRMSPDAKLDRTDEPFMKSVAKLSSPIRNLDMDALVGEDFREHRRAMRLFRGLSTGLGVLFLSALSASWFACEQWSNAELRLADTRLQNGRRALSDSDPSGGLLWFASVMEMSGGRLEGARSTARRLAGAWIVSLPLRSFIHEEPVSMAAWSPDGGTIVTASGGTVHLWDVATGTARGEPIEHPGEVVGLAFNPDGKSFVIGASDPFGHESTADLWDPVTARKLVDLEMNRHADLYDVVFSPDGKMVLTTGGAGTQRIDASTGKAIGAPMKQVDETFLAVFSPDGKTIVTGSTGLRGEADGDVRVWDAATGQQRGTGLTHNEPLTAIVFSPSGLTFATTYESGQTRIWKTRTGRISAPSLRVGGRVSALAFTADDQVLATADSSGEIRLWSVRGGKPLPTHADYRGKLDRMEFSPDGVTLTLFGADGLTRWKPFSKDPAVPVQHRSRGRALTYSADYRRVVTTDGDRAVRIWDLSPYRHEGASLELDEEAQALAYSPDAMTIAAGCSDGTTVLWGGEAGVSGRKLKNKSAITALAFTADGRQLYAANRSELLVWDRTKRTSPEKLSFSPYSANDIVLDTEHGRVATTYLDVPQGGSEPPESDLYLWTMGKDENSLLATSAAQINDLAFSPDGTLLASGWTDKRARVVRVDGSGEAAMLLHPDGVNAVVFAPHERTLATSSGSMLQLWDVSNRTPVGEPLVQGGRTHRLAFSPDGRILLAHSQGNLQLWDVDSRTPLGEAIHDQSYIQAAVFRPDGRELAVASDKTVWRVAVPVPAAGAGRCLALSVEVRAGMTIRDGVVRTLSIYEMTARQSELTALGGDCLETSIQPWSSGQPRK